MFSGVNPIGCKVYGFVKPSQNEFDHDFLWRIHKVTPPAGMIYIYNRSHYEDILVPTVEKTFPADVVAKRYEHINNFERLLTDSNVRVLKFYLHISKEVQQTRLEERLAEKRSYWKHNDGDRESREKWDQYIDVYEDIFAKTSKRNAPWVVVPADNKWYAAYVISKKIVETLEQQMKLDWPDLETERFSMQDEDEEK
ncbi:MAG: hypothetical protein H6765_01050 [Candidatus Peribacteria bacterium]|nr:MAG: hypothetical protein H6765_01050 [Candidatus Peribacteria bacterium]